MEILRCSQFQSLINLSDASRKLNEWDAIITFQSKKGAKGLTTATKKTGPAAADPLPLYAWLWKFRGELGG